MESAHWVEGQLCAALESRVSGDAVGAGTFEEGLVRRVRERRAVGNGARLQSDAQHVPVLLSQVREGTLFDAVGHDLEADLPLREGPGFVCAQDVHATKGLQGARVAHQGPAGGQALGGGELREGGEDGEPLRHGGDAQAHGGGDDLVDGAVAPEPGGGHRQRAEPRHRGREPGEVLEARLHARGSLAALAFDAGAPGLGVLPRGDDDGARRAHVDARALVEHAVAFREGSAGRRVHLLSSGLRLARQGRLIHLQRRLEEDAAIRGHHVTCLEEHDVPLHQLVVGDELLLPITQHTRRPLLPSLQRQDGPLGAVALDAADARVQAERAADERRVCHRAHHRGQGRPGRQDRRHRVGELLAYLLSEEASGAHGCGQSLAAPRDSSLVEALLAAVEALEGVLGGEGVPGDLLVGQLQGRSADAAGPADPVAHREHLGDVRADHDAPRRDVIEAAEEQGQGRRSLPQGEPHALLRGGPRGRDGLDDQGRVVPTPGGDQVGAPRGTLGRESDGQIRGPEGVVGAALNEQHPCALLLELPEHLEERPRRREALRGTRPTDALGLRSDDADPTTSPPRGAHEALEPRVLLAGQLFGHDDVVDAIEPLQRAPIEHEHVSRRQLPHQLRRERPAAQARRAGQPSKERGGGRLPVEGEGGLCREGAQARGDGAVLVALHGACAQRAGPWRQLWALRRVVRGVGAEGAFDPLPGAPLRVGFAKRQPLL